MGTCRASTGPIWFRYPRRFERRDGPMNSVILECPRCLNLFAISMFKARRIGDDLYGYTCRCGTTIEWDMDYMDPVNLWAQPHVANRIRKIEDYRVQVEGLTYSAPP